MRRKRNLQEIITILAKYAERAKNDRHFSLGESHRQELNQLLRTLEDIDEREIEKIRDIGSEELYEKAKKIYEDSEKARMSLKEGEYNQVGQYLEEILKLEKDVYEVLELSEKNRLEEKYSKSELTGSGFFGDVYALENYPDRVIKILTNTVGEKENIIRNLKRLQNLVQQVPADVHIPEFHEVGVYSGNIAMVMGKVPGKKVHLRKDKRNVRSPQEVNYERWSESNQLIAEAPQQYFDKLSKDIEILRRYSIELDNKFDNLLYHPKKGFFIVDLEMYTITTKRPEKSIKRRFRPELIEWLVAPSVIHEDKFDETKIDSEDKQNIKAILQKIDEAGNPGSQEQIERSKKIVEGILSRL